MPRLYKNLCLAVLLLLPTPLLWNAWQGTATSSPATFTRELPKREGMVRLPAGHFLMGSHDDQSADQRPTHRVRIDSFWMDIHPVTNEQFAVFVAATDYATTAERRGSSRVFDPRQGQWLEVVGANWRTPLGPDDSLAGKDRYPVVHVSWHDAVAYAAWVGKTLPTEAEYEYAARAGLSDGIYPWGREEVPEGIYQANSWQGWFPEQNHKLDGYGGTSPVGSFPANAWGLHDMAGNIWCWCADWYDAEFYGKSSGNNPVGPATGSQRVRRGGSWLSSHNYEGALRVAYRGHAAADRTTNHTGFRCVQRQLRVQTHHD